MEGRKERRGRLGDGRIDRMMDEALTWSFLDLGVDGLSLNLNKALSGAAPGAVARDRTMSINPAVFDFCSASRRAAAFGR